MVTASSQHSIAGRALAEVSEAVRSFHLSGYPASLGPPAGPSRRQLPKDVREACPSGYQDRARTLLLYPVNHRDRSCADETAVVLDVLRAGFLVLSCRRMTVDSHEQRGVAYFLYVVPPGTDGASITK